MNDLEWLARNVHEWKNGYRYAVVHRFYKTVIWDTGTSLGESFTRDQWLAERARLQNKPKEWLHAWAKYRRQSRNGVWFEYDSNPETNPDRFAEAVANGEVLGDWRGTLEPRPEEQTMTKKEWRGPEDGLPPVGTKLENWAGEIRIVVLIETDHVVCMVMESDENNRRYMAYYKTDFHESGVKLHDPRTEEDRAVEDMASIIADINPARGERKIAQALYKAGYRKQEPSE